MYTSCVINIVKSVPVTTTTTTVKEACGDIGIGFTRQNVLADLQPIASKH